MSRRFDSMRFMFVVAVGLIVPLVGSINAQKTQTGKYVMGELLVKFTGGAESNIAKRANIAMNATVLETLGDLGWQRVRLPESLSVDQAISRYSKLDGVEYAQPNFYYHLLLTPNDPQFTASGMYGLGRISAPSAWDLTTGSSTVVVADIDTGLGYTHQDIAANAWVNPAEIQGNGVDDDGNGYADDIYGLDVFNNDSNPIDDNPSTVWHGTHTAGTIGAVGNNGLGVVGVNWNVRLMSIKLYGTTGNGADSTSAMLVNAYNYVRLMKNRGVNIRVTNNSYGGCGEACGYDQATKDALDAMGNAGILNVFAAGNAGTNNDVSPNYPSNYTSPSLLAVAGTNSSDNNVFNFGLTSVDLAAPGVGILSTTFQSNSSYGTLSGTSMATPHVAGAAALLAAHNPNLSVASLKATLMNTVDQLPQLATLIKTGGRLNVDRALRNQTVCTFPTAMTVPTKGGVFTINLAPGTNCDYFVRSTSNWIKIMGGSNQQFSGNGTVTFRVTVNPTVTRVGTIKIGEQSLNVTQSRN